MSHSDSSTSSLWYFIRSITTWTSYFAPVVNAAASTIFILSHLKVKLVLCTSCVPEERLAGGAESSSRCSSDQPRWERGSDKTQCREGNRNQTERRVPTKLYNYDLIKRWRTTPAGASAAVLIFLHRHYTAVCELSRSRCSQQRPGSWLKPVIVQLEVLVSSLTSFLTSRRGEEKPDMK